MRRHAKALIEDKAGTIRKVQLNLDSKRLEYKVLFEFEDPEKPFVVDHIMIEPDISGELQTRSIYQEHFDDWDAALSHYIEIEFI